MTAVSSLKALGLRVSLNTSGSLALSGLQALSADERQAALFLAKENKSVIMAELRRAPFPLDDPTPEQLTHARRMLVRCPVQGRALHCWHCSRCSEAGACSAWHPRRADVAFFRQSEKPYSLSLVESGALEVVQ